MCIVNFYSNKKLFHEFCTFYMVGRDGEILTYIFFTLSPLASSELQPQTLLPGKELTHGVLCVNCKHEDAVFISRQSRGTLETKKKHFHSVEGDWHLDRVKAAAVVPNVRQGVTERGRPVGGRKLSISVEIVCREESSDRRDGG